MRVSVIVPVHNGRQFIHEAINSILMEREREAWLELEVIVVDNASKDGTAALVQEAFGEMVQLVHEPRLGAAFARNTGLARVTSPLVTFLDADDRWVPGRLRPAIRALEADSELSMVFCHTVEFSDPPDTYPCRDIVPLVGCSGLLARRQVFDEHQIGAFPEVRCGEFIAWYGLAQTLGHRSEILPDVLVERRVHAANTTRASHSTQSYAEAMRWLMNRRRSLASGK